MQFILTLLISVRGRKLLKDGSALSFTGRAGWFDRLASKSQGGPAWAGSRSLDWGVSCECQRLGKGREG